ncbi:translocation/assembly module TamB domain-containing protein [Sphingomonas lenta]|uniref:Translocation and assembly module TamB C-terminal domain-containing protein n=1 Tax=Sphingomonas lenta TaxID=1141887 RepID=A0A2A2SKE6_9SPHN|nr:translocation/assembly module TamB [Sphingomonas lenta]PAX09712.1 hypothetical protein CKY28_02995 [Sphingomonas lenta]
MTRWLRRIAAALAALLVLFGLALILVDTDTGRRWVAQRIGEVRTANGLRFTVGRIDGSIYDAARLRDLRVYDPQGLFLHSPEVALDWRPADWIFNRLAIDSLVVPRATLLRTPRPRPTGRQGPILPGFDILIGRARIDRLVLAPPVLGRERVGSLDARADVRDGRALIDLQAVVEGSDRLALRVDAAPDRDRFDMDLAARGSPNGVLGRLIGTTRPVALRVAGDGRWARWRGTATGVIGPVRVADLALANDAGRYALSGRLAPSLLLRGRLQRLTAPRVLVSGTGTFANRRLDGGLSLRSPALALEAGGVLDLAANAWRDVRIKGRLDRPEALFRNMTGRAIALRAILDGPLRRPKLDYRLAAERFAFDRTGFEQARAAGVVRFGPSPVVVPVRFTAARVTGAGDVAGGILRNLLIDGRLLVTSRFATGDDLRLRSDQLSGRVGLQLDLRTGEYQVSLNGALDRYLIPGLGLVEVRSNLRVVPGPDGRGMRVAGQGTARVLRLDNAFFRSMAGGLPQIVTGLERGPDGILYFRDLVLTGPSIRLTGNGYRRRDGTFFFEGAGRQARYGPVTLRLDGRIERPTFDLRFASPAPSLGLTNVVAHLDPNPQGFSYRAEGGSRLGPFRSQGAILLPPGGTAVVAVQALDVAGTRANGNVAIVTGGFDGRLRVSGRGVSGGIALRPVGDVQRVEAHLEASGAQFAGNALRQGRLDLVALLDPAGTSIEASASGQGLRHGRLSLARFAGEARLRGGVGEVRGSIAGTRGRAFDVRTVVQVAPDRYVVRADGTLDRRPLRLLTPAVLTREGEGWRMAPARLSFAGGEGSVGGLFAPDRFAIDARLQRMPLAILDIGYPGLGLSGVASGDLALVLPSAAAPTGRMNLTVRGLSRPGLVLTSRPIDMGLAGVLSPDRLGVRAVMASGGRTVGRAQALFTPLSGGDLETRLANAPMMAQLRYSGPADTLWRLTGIELFDLSGPVAIAADLRGRIDDPVIRGVVQTSGARIESARTGTVLTDVRATGRFGGSQLVIQQFAAKAGREGTVTGAGRFDFAAANGIGMDLRLQAERAPMIARDDIAATVTGPLVFRSDGAGGMITGDVVLERSRYRLGRATAATALPRVRVREINVPGGADEEGAAPVRPWTMDVRARAKNEVFVTGLGLNSEWSADLQIGGQPNNPAITGQARLIRGDYEFAGREFDLDRGVIRFDGEVPADPALDIAANASGAGLNAQIRVTGNALRPQIGFTSTPPLPEDELLSRLLFGTSITNLSAPEALQLAAAVAALRNGDAGLNPINAVRRAAGLDRLRILPADPQTGQGTSVAAGKYVTRRLYAEIVTDGQGYSATRVEFQMTRWLSLLSSISTIGRQSLNVRVSRDY